MGEKLTITEALAEIKLIGKKIDKKREFILTYGSRADYMKDPLEKEGGSVDAVKREFQSIQDLQNRLIKIRKAIQHANATNTVTINGFAMTIGDWLTWKREVAPIRERLYREIRDAINSMRAQAQRQGRSAVPTGSAPNTPNDVVVNINEKELQADILSLEETLGVLDGQLSLKNATIVIEL